MRIETGFPKISSLLKRTLFFISILLAVACSGNGNDTQELSQKRDRSQNTAEQKQSRHRKISQSQNPVQDQQKKIPEKVYKVLEYVRTHDRAPDGYQGGRKFGNYEKRLPLKDKSGSLRKYQEWDVNPKIKGKNRGAERLITSEDKHAWYTSDHYNSFTEIE